MLIRLLLVATAIWGIRRLFFGYPAAPGSRALAARERALVVAAADAMFPRGGAIPPSGSQAGVPEYVDGYVAAVPAQIRVLMRMLFLLVEHATLFFPGPSPRGRRRFSSLSESQRQAVLEGWRTSSLFPRRLAFTSLRAILCMGYLADPGVLRQLDLAPWDVESPVLEPDLLYPPVGQPRSAIRHVASDRTRPSDGTPLALDGPIHPAYRASSGAADGSPGAGA